MKIDERIINEDNLENHRIAKTAINNKIINLNQINFKQLKCHLKHQYRLAAVHARVYWLANTSYETRKGH